MIGTLILIAQDTEPARPSPSRIIEIRRDKVPPAHFADYQSSLSRSVYDCKNGGHCPNEWLGLLTVTGPLEVWRMSMWDQFGTMARKTYRGDEWQGSHGLIGHPGESTATLAVYRSALSTPASVEFSTMRYLAVSIVEVRPGKAAGYEEARRLIRATMTAKDARSRTLVYRAVSGMTGETFLVLTPLRHVQEVEEIADTLDAMSEPEISESNRRRIQALLAESVRRSETKLLWVVPYSSHPYPPR